jgi:hypothetical protein
MVTEKIIYAPIILFCFKRIDTLTKCVEHLKLCPESIHSDLYIYSDAARNDQEFNQVNVVRNFIKNINGFKSLKIINREVNMGVDYNIIQGIQEMAEKFESIIVVEDDLVVSNQFLHFMNAGLSHLMNFEKVLSVSAFNYVKIPQDYKYDCYFAQRTNPWGWATWSHKIKEVDWDLALTDNFLTNPSEKKPFNKWGSDRSRMLRRTLEGEIRAWDIRLDYYQHKRDLISAYSIKNLVVNIGFNSEDASNTNGYNRFKVKHENFTKFSFLFPDFIVLNSTISRRFIIKNSFFSRLFTSFFKLLKIKNE